MFRLIFQIFCLNLHLGKECVAVDGVSVSWMALCNNERKDFKS